MLLLKCMNIMVMHNFIFSVEAIPGPEVNEVKAKFSQEEKVCYMHTVILRSVVKTSHACSVV